ncbi:MAG: NADH-quinone oxidoreductase subunit L [Actinobacteria bacterium]|nr:NADH-quinone oxidoreductase subunit L [Actinomycetota bacterium]
MGAVLVAIPAVPFGVCALLLVGGGVASRLGGAPAGVWRRAAGWLSAGGTLVALVAALAVFFAVRSGDDPALRAVWFRAGALEVPFSLQADGLQTVMVVVVAAVSFLVHLYSVGYMHGDRDAVVYFAELSLFSGAMLLLVLAANFFLLYVAWELVGASSYLLISYYFERPAAAAAGKKAFLTTRIGDLGLLVGIFAIVRQTGSLDYGAVFAEAQGGGLGGAWATAIPLLLFAGAAGKSAQFPLHVWLPDAMEGPTPVSALIHAATMVAAGVYLVARTFAIFAASPAALDVVAGIGAFTALMAATIAATQRDIKKVLAYSTISQLGFMVAALGAGAPAAAVFHLFTHAWFKATLFLGAGSVIHATGRQVVEELGGLARRMPLTAGSFVVGALALAGVPPFAGFWSKEEILGVVAASHPALLLMLLAASFLTAFYVFRLVFLVFFGPGSSAAAGGTGRGGEDELRAQAKAAYRESSAAAGGTGRAVEEVAPKEHPAGLPRESGPVMVVPLLLLAAASLAAGLPGAGFLGRPLQSFLGLVETGEGAPGTPVWLTVAAVLVALAGVALAWAGYGRRSAAGADLDARLEAGAPWAYGRVAAGYHVDAFYARVLIGSYTALAGFLARTVDAAGIDGLVNGIAYGTLRVGRATRRLQSGEVRDYVAAVVVGVVLLAAFLLGAH